MTIIRNIILATALAFSLSGCMGEKVTVPPASVGMVLGANGYQGDIIPPSRFRLSPCLFNCDKLVVIEAGDAVQNESFKIRMPKEQLDFNVAARLTVALSTERQQLVRVFDRVTPTPLASGNYGTTLQQVYDTYGAVIVANTVRGVISEMSMNDVQASQTAVSETIRLKLVEAFKRTPMEIREFSLTTLDVPQLMKDAYEANQRKIMDIQKADADAQVKIREAQARLEVQKANREADVLAAQTMAETNKILADGVTPEYLRYMELQVLTEMAKNQNAIFFPVDMMGSTAMQNRILNTK